MAREAEQGRAARIAADPRYRDLVRRRNRFGFVLTAIVLVVYFGFILLVAFDKPLLAAPIAGGATSLGIPIGIGIILLSVVLTGVYVRRANTDYDAALAAIVAEHGA
ncbi:DUF485 domain-containing protein [Sphingomonas sp. Y38-1Y]|uniref:DUF485 domain-containing protein n=1 Tax=Sphingomonas sp. Y38-1Y TaxID=3078265 RepID=UPI0028EB23A2|nr:DUF485 domain-containing protein [Sphingomonas sp. Y38-1Y]